MEPQQSRSFSSEFVVIIAVALVGGLIEATLIQTHRVAGVDPFHYVPARVWFYVPLAWIGIAMAMALPAYALSRRRGALIVLCALPAILVGCRIALFSRKWAFVALMAVFLALVWITRHVRLPQPRRARLWLIALSLVAAFGVLAAIPRPATRETGTVQGPNVLIIFADTLRYDAVFRPDGSVKPELPSLKRFASESTIFDAAYAASSWTTPSHFAAVTGLDAHLLGVDFDHQTFEEPAITLAARFRRNGYRTAAVISNPFLHERSGFARGFDVYEHAGRALDVCRTAPLTVLAQVWPRFAGSVCWWSANQVSNRALKQMTEGTSPWLVVLNFMDAHEPSYLEPDCRAGAPPRHNTLLRLQVREPPLYHAAVRCLDKRLSALFDRASASTRGTVVVFTSDHGEHLHERGLMGHGQSLFPELLHVPLMVRTVDGRRGRILTPVSLTQLSSLLSPAGVSAVPERVIVSTLVHPAALGGEREISVIRGPWQLITRSQAAEELIDLRNAKTVKTSPLLSQLRADTAAVERSWPRQRATRFRSIGYIH